MKVDLVLLSILGLFGVLFFLIGIIIRILRVKNRKNCTSVTNGKVIAIQKRINRAFHEYSVMYHPVFSYYANGYNIEVEDPIGTNPPAFFEGQDVEIHYDPHNIRKYYVGNSNLTHIISVVFIVIGVFIFASGLVLGIMMYL